MKDKLISFINKYRYDPNQLSQITGYSVDSINSQITGRRNVQEKLIRFLELYDNHEELKKKFDIKITPQRS